MNTTKKNFSPMKKFATILIVLLAIAPAMTFAQTGDGRNNKKTQTTEVKIVLVTNDCSKTAMQTEIKTENKTQNVLDILQKESEETVIYPLVQLAHRIQQKIQAMDKKNMVSSGSAGTEGEAGGGPSR
ncbi:hypothetical protein LBMAG27_13550 [Bacteroidota bacterium]|nr:hypothetical protein LBMAG27_13550 [Bacteroidota bacterium]